MIRAIVYIIFIVLVVGILVNAGYHIGEEWSNSQGGIVDPTFAQKFLLGPDKVFEFEKELTPTSRRVLFSLIGIPLLIVAILCWAAYFMFFGGMFPIIGTIPSVLATFASVAIVAILFKRRHNHKEPTTT